MAQGTAKKWWERLLLLLRIPGRVGDSIVPVQYKTKKQYNLRHQSPKQLFAQAFFELLNAKERRLHGKKVLKYQICAICWLGYYLLTFYGPFFARNTSPRMYAQIEFTLGKPGHRTCAIFVRKTRKCASCKRAVVNSSPGNSMFFRGCLYRLINDVRTQPGGRTSYAWSREKGKGWEKTRNQEK